MEINQENLLLLNQRINTDFQVGFASYQPFWQRIAFESRSQGPFNVYAWLSAFPQWRKWVGHRIFKHLAVRPYILHNEPWEVSIEIREEVVKRDQFGFYTQIAQKIGAQGARLRDKWVADALLTGKSTNCYDGQYFFDTDHPVDIDNPAKGVYSNLITNRPLTVDNVLYLKTVMAKFTDEEGQLRKVRPNLLVTPPSLAQAGAEAVAAQYARPMMNGGNVVGGIAMPNPNAGMEHLVIDELEAEPDYYYLFSTEYIMPFVVQVEDEPQPVDRTAAWMDNMFHRRMCEWGANASGGAGFTYPFLALRVKTTA